MTAVETSFLSPAKIVDSFDLPRGSVAADFGSGTGFYTMALAKKVGPQGKVYAFDIQPHAVDLVRSSARLAHMLHVETHHANLETPHGSRLKDAVVDFVLIASILHQADDKPALLKEAARITKPGRAMAMIEWDEGRSLGGPPAELRVSRGKAKELAEASGFLLDREFAAGSQHYGLLFKKR
jgi:ubiquinone/menaquinone biosynthesis C-methylase UbiE